MTITDSNNRVRRVEDNGITNEEIIMTLAAKQASLISSIKSMVTFFTVLALISVCMSILAFFGVTISV